MRSAPSADCHAVCYGLGHFGFRQIIHNFGVGIAGTGRGRWVYFQDGDGVYVFVYLCLKYVVFYGVVNERRILISSYYPPYSLEGICC